MRDEKVKSSDENEKKALPSREEPFSVWKLSSKE